VLVFLFYAHTTLTNLIFGLVSISSRDTHPLIRTIDTCHLVVGCLYPKMSYSIKHGFPTLNCSLIPFLTHLLPPLALHSLPCLITYLLQLPLLPHKHLILVLILCLVPQLYLPLHNLIMSFHLLLLTVLHNLAHMDPSHLTLMIPHHLCHPMPNL